MSSQSSPGAELGQNGSELPVSESSIRNETDAAEVREMLAPAPAPMATLPPITKASVRVMRSHDYCHFEVVLTSDLQAAEPPLFVVNPDSVEFDAQSKPIRLNPGDKMQVVPSTLSLAQVDALRKEAARLVDKAVEQFKTKKAAISRAANAGYSVRRLQDEAMLIESMPESERTPEQQATLKSYQDELFHASRRYDYEDDWSDDGDSSDDSDLY